MVGILQDTVIMTYSNLKYTTVVTLKLVSGIVQWVDNYTKDYMSMLDLYESVEVVGDTIEGIDEEVTDSEKEEDGNGVTLKFKDYDYKQSEEDDDKGAKNVEANDTLFDQIVAGDTIKETHKELGDISIKEYNS
ncbi:hypothetical protein TB2_030378 [Malus domestica]